MRGAAGAERIALDGKTVIPGLINAHGHASSVANLATYAAYGVTAVYSLGDETPEVFAARDAQRTTPPTHARVYLAGPVLTPTTPEEARAQVEEPGKWADFVVLDASPLTDIRNIRKQHSVWIGGRQVNTRGR